MLFSITVSLFYMLHTLYMYIYNFIHMWGLFYFSREHQESETDTEEFEKVGCSGGSDGTFSPMEVRKYICCFSFWNDNNFFFI